MHFPATWIWHVYICSYCIVFCSFTLSFSSINFCSVDNSTERDHYIGLQRGIDMCTCYEGSIPSCHDCQLTWRWHHGDQMSYLSWVGEDMYEPKAFDCGRISPVGWLSNDCSVPLKYICERQVCLVVLTVQLSRNSNQMIF